MEQQQRPEEKAPYSLSRREFLQRIALVPVGTGVLASAFAGCTLTPAQRSEAAEAVSDRLGQLPKVALGTRMDGMQVSRVLLCQDNASELLAPSLAAGMNYIHKAGYWRSLPEELKKVPRDSYYTDITVDSTPNDPDNEEKAYTQVVSSLAANGLKYYDIFRAHYGWKSVKIMKEQRGTHRAFERLRKEGKVKYFGVSQHPFVPYPDIIQAEIDEGLISSIQAWITPATTQADLAIFEKARKAGIGIIAMKTVAYGGQSMRANPARMAELKAPNMIGRACLRHVLELKGADGKPYIDCAVSALHNFGHFEENLGSVATKVAALDGFSTTA